MVIRRARTVGAPMQVCCAVCIIIHSSVQLYISMCVCMCMYYYTYYCIVIHSSVCVYYCMCVYTTVVCVCVVSLFVVCVSASSLYVYVCLRARVGEAAAPLLLCTPWLCMFLCMYVLLSTSWLCVRKREGIAPPLCMCVYSLYCLPA